jgi:Fic family protein
MNEAKDPCANPSTEYQGLSGLSEWIEQRLDLDQWERSFSEFERQRQTAAAERIAESVETAIRAAAAATGAIEGLYPITTGQTIMVADRAPNWQAELNGAGNNSLALFEAQLAAYHLATSLATSDIGLTASGIRQMHIELCTPQLAQEPDLRLGEYKNKDNCTNKSDGTIHRYARWADAGPELDRLLDVVRSGAFSEAHPAVQAAFAHLGLAAIHPFEDGNGRVARALGSAILQRTIGVPLIIYADQKNSYLAALERADIGDYGPSLRFIFDRCLDSIRFIADRAAASTWPSPEEFERLYRAHAGMTYQEVTNLATRVISQFTAEFTAAGTARPMSPIFFNAGAQQRGGSMPLGDAFRGTEVNGTMATYSNLVSPPPASGQVQLTYGMFIARDITARFPLVIANWDAPDDRFEIRLDDVHPGNTTDYTIRRRAWIDRKLSEAIARLYEQARASRGL